MSELSVTCHYKALKNKFCLSDIELKLQIINATNINILVEWIMYVRVCG